MSAKGIHYRLTTAEQRKLLFEKWGATGDVSEACRVAHVGLGTFYHWKPRFEEQGYAGLEKFGSRVAHKTNRKEAVVEQHVVEVRRAHPEWGKTRIADELNKEHNWVAVISPNTVRRILREAGLWVGKADRPKKRVSATEPPNERDKPPI